MILTEDQADQILRADFANIVRKVKNGKPLTSQERALLQARASGQMEGPARVTTKVQLAKLLGVSRRGLQNWTNLEGWPKANPDGSWDLVACREFVRGHGLKPSEELPETERLKARRLLAQCRKLEVEIGQREAKLIERDDVIQEAARIFAGIRVEMEGWETLAPQLAGLPTHEIAKRLREAVREMLHKLSEKKWKPPPQLSPPRAVSA